MPMRGREVVLKAIALLAILARLFELIWPRKQ